MQKTTSCPEWSSPPRETCWVSEGRRNCLHGGLLGPQPPPWWSIMSLDSELLPISFLCPSPISPNMPLKYQPQRHFHPNSLLGHVYLRACFWWSRWRQPPRGPCFLFFTAFLASSRRLCKAISKFSLSPHLSNHSVSFSTWTTQKHLPLFLAESPDRTPPHFEMSTPPFPALLL